MCKAASLSGLWLAKVQPFYVMSRRLTGEFQQQLELSFQPEA